MHTLDAYAAPTARLMAKKNAGRLARRSGVPSCAVKRSGFGFFALVGALGIGGPQARRGREVRNDEVAVDLAWKILQATKADLGAAAIDERQEALLEEMVVVDI